jgi:hypothetical protein
MGRLVYRRATATGAIHRAIQHEASLDFTDGEVYVASRLCKMNLHKYKIEYPSAETETVPYSRRSYASRIH